ncbi:CheR family methyltransferase [Magnetococcales bacterium HHB-1]
MTPDSLNHFRTLVLKQTGLVIPDQDLPHLKNQLKRQIKKVNLTSFDHYLTLLEDQSAASTQEWRSLMLILTTGESYFFRDTGQMDLLRQTILPELIQRRQMEKELTIWSAGCSTGEEPYTLAILIEQTLPSSEGWNITIIGSDINEEALNQARRGRYNNWSFRRVDPQIKNRYFVPNNSEWAIIPRIREQVSFRTVNLIKDPFPHVGSPLSNIDLILCRNVFIYFNQNTVKQLVAKFSNTLKPGGYLLTGHAEINRPDPHLLIPIIYPESVVYQRPLSAQPVSTPKPTPNPFPSTGQQPKPFNKPRETKPFNKPKAITTQKSFRLPPIQKKSIPTNSLPITTKKESAKDDLKRAKKLFKKGSYNQAQTLLENLIQEISTPKEISFNARLLLIRTLTNRGAYDQAWEQCQDSIKINEFSPHPYFFSAQILLHRKNINDPKARQEVKDLLNRTLYLDHDHIPAYLELASILHQEKNIRRAKKMWQTALELLETLPPQERIPHYEEWMAKELAEQVRTQLNT